MPLSRRGILAVFVGFVTLATTWAASLPLNAGPDEGQHLIWAVAAAHGNTTIGEAVPDEASSFDSVLGFDQCFQFQPTTKAADCTSQGEAPIQRTNRRPIEGPPIYHAVLGLPSLVHLGVSTLYAMRFLHVLMVAALFTVGVTSLSRLDLTPASMVAIGVTLTPTNLFFASVVNPTGVAIAAGFAIWGAGLALIDDRASLTTPSRLAALVGPTAVFMVLRRDSVLWIVCIALGLAAVAAVSSGGLRRLWSKIPAAWLAISVAICGAAAAVSVAFTGTDSVSGFQQGGDVANAPGSWSDGFGATERHLREMLVVLGWVDTHMPNPVLFFWYGAIASVVLLAANAMGRLGWVLVGMMATSVFASSAIDAIRYPYYQGRYGVPFAIGIPLVAAFALRGDVGRSVLSRVTATRVLTLQAAMLALSLWFTLRRFTVTTRGGWLDVITKPRWTPPGPLPVWTFVAAEAVMLAVIVYGVRRNMDRRSSTTPVSGS